jgi:DNA polymerase III alpha subunit
MIAKDSPVPEFRERYQTDSVFKHWIDVAIQVSGAVASVGVHAAGVVIAGSDIEELIPLMLMDDGTVATQYDMDMIPKFGFLKMDFLGLITLGIMDKAVENIKKSKGVTVISTTCPWTMPQLLLCSLVPRQRTSSNLAAKGCKQYLSNFNQTQ